MSKMSIFCLFIFMTLGCAPLTQKNPDKEELVCLQIIDRNDVTETISSKDRLQRYLSINFDQPQPYKQVLRVYSKSNSKKHIGILSCYHSNGHLWQSLDLVDSRAKGKYIEWFPNGQKKVEATVLEGPANFSDLSKKQWLFDKTSFVWDEQGHLFAEIHYDKGVLYGKTTYFHTDGSIKKIIPYEDNLPHGVVEEFDTNNALLKRTHYNKGKKEGKEEGFWKKDCPSFIEIYEQGKLSLGYYYDEKTHLISTVKNGEGTAILYKNFSIWKKIPIINGLPNGKVVKYTRQGEKEKTFHVLNGKKQGEEIFYFSKKELLFSPLSDSQTLQPKLSLFWDDGHIHGTVKTWYTTGRIKSQHEMTRNKKNGMYFVWYKDGQVMLVEEYENDRLINGKYFKSYQKDPVSKVLNGKGTATIFDGDGALIKKISYDKGSPVE